MGEEIQMGKRYDDRYGRGGYRRDRDRADDRGYAERAGDEVRSWFGDDEAQRRRNLDELHDRQHERTYSSDWDRRDWQRDRSDWDRSSAHADWRRPGSRDDSNRQQDWSRSNWNPSNWGQSHWNAESRPSDWHRPEYVSAANRDAMRRSSAQGGWDRERGNRSYEDAWRYGNREYYDYQPTRPSREWSLDDGRTEFGGQRYGRGPKGYQRSDSRINEDVCDRLTYSDVDAENIEVRVQNGEVTLSGWVRERWDKRRAEDVAEDVAGVRDVHNNIRVNRETRGIGQSDTSVSDQPGTVLGVNPTSSSTIANAPPKGSTRS
jgi:osmotically-inducible protein OsmY